MIVMEDDYSTQDIMIPSFLITKETAKQLKMLTGEVVLKFDLLPHLQTKDKPKITLWIGSHDYMPID